MNMRNTLILTVMLFTAFSVSAATWSTNFEEAKAESVKSKKPMLVLFTGSDWCGYCIKLEKEVFSKSEFEKWAKDNVILVKLDFPRRTKQSDELKKQNRTLAGKFAIRGYPTVLFMGGDEKVVGKSGYMRGGPAAWIANASKIVGK